MIFKFFQRGSHQKDSRINRRRFLSFSTIAIAGLALPCVGLLGCTRTRSRKRFGANVPPSYELHDPMHRKDYFSDENEVVNDRAKTDSA